MAPAPAFSTVLLVRTVVAWIVTLLLFFPLGWLVLTAFKTELQAISCLRCCSLRQRWTTS